MSHDRPIRALTRSPSPNRLFLRNRRSQTERHAPRVGSFAKRRLVPSKWLGTIAGVHSRELHIDIQLDGVDTELSERLAQSLRQIVSVRSVLTSEKRLLLFG